MIRILIETAALICFAHGTQDNSEYYLFRQKSVQNFYQNQMQFLPEDTRKENEIQPRHTATTMVSTKSEFTEYQSSTNDIEKSRGILKNLEEFFDPQIPLPGEEYFDAVELVNNSLRFSNCSQLNRTICEERFHAPVLDQTAVTKAVILCAIAFFSFFGNIATLTSILRTRRQSTSTVYMLLVQLAIADLLVTLFCILTDALWMLTVQWYGGNLLCKGVKFMQMFSLYLSTFVLVLIGFDRLCAVRFPMARARAKHHVRTGIVCIWTLSAIFSAPQTVIFSVMRGPFIEEFYQCVTYVFYTAPWQEQLLTTLSLILMFLLPLLILIITYITTFITIANSGQENMFSERVKRSAIDDARRKILHKAKIKSLMITVVIVLTFVICWTPYYVTMIIFIFLEPGEELSQNLQAAVFFFGSSTAMINPLIYGAFHLRPRRKPRFSKSTSINNNSSSSRVELSLMIVRKGCQRRSREENSTPHVNGEFLTLAHNAHRGETIIRRDHSSGLLTDDTRFV